MKGISGGIRKSATRISKAASRGIEKGAGDAIHSIGTGTEKVAGNVLKNEEEHASHLKSLDKPHERGRSPKTPAGGSSKRRASRSPSRSPSATPKRPKKSASKYPLPAKAKRDPKQDSTKVDPRTHDLAVKVNEERKKNNDRSGKNYAAFEFEDEHGNKHVEIGHSQGSHSERVVGVPLLDRMNEPGSRIKVTRIYSERDYCNQKSPNCNDWTRHYFPDAERTHGFEYDHHTAGSKKAGNKALRQHISWLFSKG